MVVDHYVWLVSLAWTVFMIPATWLYHVKFMMKDGTIVFPQFVTGWKNVSIAGGLLALILLDTSRPAWLFPPEGLAPFDRRLRASSAGSADLSANVVEVDDRPHLDAARSRPRELGRHAHGFVDAVGFDDVEAGDDLFVSANGPSSVV